MYTEQNRGFTVITNFGCDNHCKYCISKHHPILQNKQTEIDKIDWTYLEECISKTKAPTVNLSGGGDPFYNWQSNIEFFYHMYDLVTKHNKKLDIHTRILPTDVNLLSLFRKIGLSVEYYDIKAIDNLRSLYPSIKEYVNIRTIQVVDSKITELQCREYIKTMKDIGIKQCTFRQMFGNKQAYNHFLELKDLNWEDGVMFLPDGEYHNYYFTTTNELYPYFFGNTESDRLEWMKIYEDIEQSCN